MSHRILDELFGWKETVTSPEEDHYTSQKSEIPSPVENAWKEDVCK